MNRNQSLPDSSHRGIFFIALYYIESWIFWGGCLLVGYGLITSTFKWWYYFRRTQLQSWYQSGWISPNEFPICIGSTRVRMPLSQIAHKIEYPDCVLLILRNGQSYSIISNMLETDELWQRLCTLQLASE